MRQANTPWAIEIARGLAAGGVRSACICPGSRSTPLALAVDAHPAIESRTIIDERSAGFFALGVAKASDRPAAVITTSGTAVAELLPAVVEAHEARVPLLVLSADRPAELRDTGANQTIDQTRIFSPYVRWEEDLNAPSTDALAVVAGRLEEAVGAAWIPPAGPVHVNVPMRKPLEPDAAGIDALTRLAAEAAPDPRPAPAPLGDGHNVPRLLGERGLIVVGPRQSDGLREKLLALGKALHVPVLADGLSGLRFGPGADHATSSYDLFLGHPDVARHLRPDWVLQFGATPTSSALHSFLSLHGARRFHVDETARGRDDIPGRVRMLDGPAAAVVDALLDDAETGGKQRAAWTAAWQAMEEAARDAEEAARKEAPDAETTLVASFVATADRLFVGNSLPVRDLDRFGRPQQRAVDVLANRGASGIDGTIATACGIAAAAGTTTAVIGDVAFQHDVGSLACLPDGLRLVVIDNGGGRIFGHLPIRDHPRFDDLFLTPPSVDVGKACRAFGFTHRLVDAVKIDADHLADAVQTALDDVQVVQVRTDGEAATAFRRDVTRQAGHAAWEALRSSLGAGGRGAQPS